MSHSNKDVSSVYTPEIGRKRFLQGFGNTMIFGAIAFLVAGLVGVFPEGNIKEDADQFLVASSLFEFILGFGALYKAKKIKPNT